MARNAIDIWALTRERDRFEFYTYGSDDVTRAHLGIFSAPEARYANLGGMIGGAKALLPLVPSKAVLTAPPTLAKIAEKELPCTAVHPGDIMVVERGRETLGDIESTKRLGKGDIDEYLTFGSSFDVTKAAKRWTLERLDKNFAVGAFSGGKLAAVASLVAWLPEMAVVMGVETKQKYRGRGLGSAAVSAVVGEALRRSEACSLTVSSDNTPAIGLYRKLGFRKVGEDVWIDLGTGISP